VTRTSDVKNPSQGKVDFTLMYVFHEAFRRDLSLLSEAIGAHRTDDPAVRAGWGTFKKQLHVHHSAEDSSLWPALRTKLETADDVAVIDQMEAEHAQLDPLVGQVQDCFDDLKTVGGAERVRELSAQLMSHMDHEERQALPLIETYLGRAGWDAFRGEMRKTYGIKGGAELFPWLLDGASATTIATVLRTLPLPARILYRMVWRPRYTRTPRWEDAAA
jgi:iron-sulfur cluster repair protein YtfE (RIC family)